jgi:dephospho-CoA kinase
MSPNSDTISRIGIAGYMGAGKSTCAGLLATTGMRVIDADREAKLMMNGDESIRRQLAAAFGDEVIDENSVGFGMLGKAAFASVKSMRLLNTIVHPPLINRLHDLVVAGSVSCILDAALIPMWGIEAWFDLCLWISTPKPLRVIRVRAKTGLPPGQIAPRMSVQEALVSVPSGPQWRHIRNEGSESDLQNQLAGIQRPPADRVPGPLPKNEWKQP